MKAIPINKKKEKPTALFNEVKKLCKANKAKGGILIMQKSDGSGNHLTNYNLSPEECRENLCLGIYYNEKMILSD